MIRNLKVLGLALVAVLAMSAMMASAASAQTFTATAGAKITASDTGKVKFTVTGEEVWCEEVSYSGTAPAASFTSITVEATYNKCRTAVVNPAPVTGFGAGGCDFKLYANGTADLVCPVGKDVTVDAGPCVVHIPGQAGLGTLTYTNDEVNGDVNIAVNVTKVKGTHTDGFLCPFGGSGESSTGVLETAAGESLTAKASVGTLTWDK